ncbi:single-stranded DNA-binding protein [Melissococcus plutonius]|uniref:Single-stranded DNA-binding protein n=2 Tax=Melissococcus plutonius TaxID=33970 RepID=A0A2Z5Y040_9ENTE|nr:single-stranded DNA-binding protein [Melissococcus plutonius]BAL61316.1 single-stranded DNA-binding protein [Melissococcus plutonius DAT561]MCV2498718.1 single-stranded DNA-binding protein [Melissococcus plutonius]MCV2505002.1 single-stranded DNA-binding protein [Melissococcus plutonius]MCV2507334.1 single-stranded DNA-binding protein [Melissococcus plutonius]MCV2519824.1 single-stranded DNA-binding protein [Melissococcus plutonius]
MINNVVLVGRLTKDPDLRYTSNGSAVATFTLAINRNFTNQNGDREADFINCVIWRKPAETLANYARKGTLLGVVGRIQSRSYENQQGQRVYVTEVICDNFQLLESRSVSEQRQQQDNNGFNNGNNQSSSNNGFGNNSGGYNSSFNPSSQSQNNSMPDFDNKDTNPFGNAGSTIDISDDDLPF